MAESETGIRTIKFTIPVTETAEFAGAATTTMSTALTAGDGDEPDLTIPRLATAARAAVIAVM